tara:strand:- start:1316 stop:1585 length:270 start_codon:yes stop_codon:yes gene_type:complete
MVFHAVYLWSIFHLFTGHEAVVKALISAGEADLQIMDLKNQTPLHKACAFKRQECVAALLDAGAPVNVEDADGHCPLYYASANGAFELI